MLALLVCLFLIMGSLRSFREPGASTQRIISNLSQSLQQVIASSEQDSLQDSEQDSVQDSVPSQDDFVAGSQEPIDSELAAPTTAPEDLSQVPNLNLREDLELQDWLGLVQDGSLTLQKLEMPAYWRMLSIVKNASFQDLISNADSKVRFNELYSSAAKNRSKLITLNVNVRKISQYAAEANPAGIDVLYEVWGWSETSKAWLYVFVTPELPAGLDETTKVNQNAKFAGYFYKLQGYHPGGAKPNAKPLLAPLLIGKFELASPPPPAIIAPANSIEMILGGAVLLAGVIVIGLRMFVFRAKKPLVARSRPLPEFNGFPPEPTPTRSETNLDSDSR